MIGLCRVKRRSNATGYLQSFDRIHEILVDSFPLDEVSSNVVEVSSIGINRFFCFLRSTGHDRIRSSRDRKALIIISRGEISN